MEAGEAAFFSDLPKKRSKQQARYFFDAVIKKYLKRKDLHQQKDFAKIEDAQGNRQGATEEEKHCYNGRVSPNQSFGDVHVVKEAVEAEEISESESESENQ